MNLVSQFARIPNDDDRVRAIRLARTAIQETLNDFLATADSKDTIRNAIGASLLAKTIQNLNEAFPESDDFTPTVPEVRYRTESHIDP